MEKNFFLTPDQMASIAKLQEISQRADEISRLILSQKCFSCNQERALVWEEDGNFEYLTYNGVWQVRYHNYSYDVRCDHAGIYDLLASKHFSEHNLTAVAIAINHVDTNSFNLMLKAYPYFMAFVSRLMADNAKSSASAGELF